MNDIQRRGALLTVFSGALLCAGLLVGCKDLFHPDGPTEYTVTFYAKEAIPAMQTRTVNKGDSVGGTMPPNPGKGNYRFGGWWTSQNGAGRKFTAETIVNEDITVYAKWLDYVPDLSLADSLAWIRANVKEGGNYSIMLKANESLEPQMLSFGGKTVSITLIGQATERTLSLSSTGSLFMVGNGVTLTLGNNVILRGLSNNTAGLVQVGSGGILLMQSGSKITGNSNAASNGGGVYVAEDGMFRMNDGEISNNAAFNGGAVYVAEDGAFSMNDGEISNNAASNGGGVYVAEDGMFRMNDGEIDDNTSSNGGGDVYIRERH